MAKGKRSRRSQATPSGDSSSPDISFRQYLDRNMEYWAEKGKWESWLHCALETGDPQFWPQIRKYYREDPKVRWMVLFHLRIYWLEHEHMVAPLFREALRDPEQCSEALQAVDIFPSLRPEVVACLENYECLGRIWDSLPQAVACLKEHPGLAVPLLRKALRDPACRLDGGCSWVALQVASAFPELAEDVIDCVRDPEFVRRLEPDQLVSCLAVLFGLLVEPPKPTAFYAWGGVDPILHGVRAELKRRYALDLDQLVSGSQ